MKYLLLFTLFMQIQSQANPLDLLQNNSKQNGWIAYKVPAQDNTRSMCCWDQISDSIRVTGHSNLAFKSCDLNKKNQGYGTNDSSPITKNINIFVKLKHGKVKQILSVGDSCQINPGKQKVTWLESVNEKKSLDFLQTIAQTANEKIAQDSLYAMSSLKGEQASKTLFNIGLLNKDDISENAVFWLGETRHDGVKYLKRLFNKLPKGETKHHINFALAQAKSDEAIEFLKSIANSENDTEQRSDAIFWLSQSDVKDIVPFLLNFIETDNSHKVQEKAIFSLAQVETEQASDALLKLAKTHQSKKVRKQALFWLVEVNPKKAKQIVYEILKNNRSKDEQDNAVFTLSRIDEESGNDEGLFGILFGDYSKSVKKKALFWLAQSENKETIDRLAALL